MSAKEAKYSFEDLSKVFAYDPKTGKITWRVKVARNIEVGAEAGGVSVVRKVAGGAYRYISYGGQHFQGARIAWLLGHGEWPPQQVGVKDGDALNLALDNLFLRNTVKGEFASKAEYHAAHHRENPHVKRKHLVKKYGLTPDEHFHMLAAQRFVCAICERPETRSRGNKMDQLHIDHDHSSGAVRGLLCARCNLTLGKMEDSPALLRAAADYIERHRAEAQKEDIQMKDTA